MATGGCDTSMDSGVTCSICLEPYKGRQPKLLPCSHTFCLPCLTHIADKERKRLRQMTSEEEDVDVIITCPTCRSPVTLPPTGVAGLLTNVYLDASGVYQPDPRPFLCDLCEEGQEAKFTCATCLTYFCTRCCRMHDKLCKSGQVSEVTARSARMSKGKVDPVQHGQSTKNLEFKVDLLTNLLTSLQNQNTLMCRDLTSMHEKHDKEMTSLKVACKKDRDAVTLLEREVAKLRDKNAILCQDKEQLRNDVTNLQSNVTRVHDSVTTLQVGLDKLQGEQGAVQSDIAAFRAEQGKGQAEFNTLKAEQGKDKAELNTLKAKQSKEQAELNTLKTDLNTLKVEQGKGHAGLKSLKTEQGKDKAELNTLKAEQSKEQAELNTLKTDLNTLKVEQGKGQAGLKSLKTELNTLKIEQGKFQGAPLKSDQGKLQNDLKKVESDIQALMAQQDKVQDVFKKQVAFQAWRAGDVTLNDGDTLICNQVITSVGGGYDDKTGMFTVPVSGLYYFIVTTRCANDDLNESCMLDIMLDYKDIAFLCTHGKTKSTAHVTVHATAGQKVYLRSFNDDNKFYAGVSTAFTGFLVQSDFFP